MSMRLFRILLVVPIAAQAQKAFQAVDMVALGVGNASLSGVGGVTNSAFPYGNPTYAGGGVPFIISSANNQMWSSAYAPGGNGQGDVTQTFSVSANNVYGVYTLANTWWGVSGTFVTYTFNFSDGTNYSLQLTNGVNLRDFNKFTNFYQNTVNGTTSKTFYDDPYTQSRIDRQWVDLDAAGFGGKNMTSFVVKDTGGWGQSRIFIAAMTFQTGQAGEVALTAVPEPSACGLALGGLALAGAAIRRRRMSAR